jgi:hypothetical protein
MNEAYSDTHPRRKSKTNKKIEYKNEETNERPAKTAL